ncbi:MAG: HD domain-containing protein [Rhodoferax sp.]|nr:HD domain-containing protein [Rhodoferax sp.]
MISSSPGATLCSKSRRTHGAANPGSNAPLPNYGAARYGAEKVTQLQHALQCAQLAEKSGADPALLLAALLHDLGHMRASRPAVRDRIRAAAPLGRSGQGSVDPQPRLEPLSTPP